MTAAALTIRDLADRHGLTLRALRLYEPLSLWTVYERPRDYPEGFLARRWAVTQDGAIPTEDVVKAPTLAECRAGLPRGLVAMQRHDHDTAALVEVWL